MASENQAKEEVAEKGLTPRSLIIGVILTVAFTALFALGASTMIWEHTNAYLGALYFMFPFLLIVALVQNKVKFTSAELSIIYVMLFTSFIGFQMIPADIASSYQFGQRFGWAEGGLKAAWPWAAPFVPPHWGNEWFWVIGTLLFVYMGMFYSYIWRKQIVETERLPFPLTQVPVSLIESVTTKTEGRNPLFTNKMFWLGFFVAILYATPAWLAVLSVLLKIPKPIPVGGGTGIGEPKTSFYVIGGDFESSTLPLFYPGGVTYQINLIPVLYSILPNASAVIVFSLGAIAAGFLLPMDVAMSATVAWILLFWIAPPIQVAMGIFPIEIKPGVLWYWASIKYWYNDVRGLDVSWWLTYAVPVALFIAPLIHHRSYFISTIKAAIKGDKVEKRNWEDPYRLYWAGLIILLILNIAWTVAFGVSILTSIFMVFFFLVMMGGLMRVGAEGWAIQVWRPPGNGFLPIAIILSSGWDSPTARNAENFAAVTLFGYKDGGGAWTASALYGDPGGCYGEGIGLMRVGQQLKSRLIDVLIATGIGAVLSAIIATSIADWYNAIYPFRFGNTGTAGAASILGGPLLSADTITGWTTWLAGVIGWIIVYFVRVRFTWFFLNPVGFIIATAIQRPAPATCFSITLAWIIKKLAVRIGGAKLVDRLQWFFIGCILGLLMVHFFHEIVRIYADYGIHTCVCGF
jgi:hypothetical protein